MTTLAWPLQWPDAVLRAARPPGLGPLVFMLVAFGSLYGAAMGSFWSGDAGVRPLQMLYSALKVPMLLVVTFALSLPSYFVINTLLGLREDFAEAIRALVATQAGLTIILASLAPVTLLWYASFDDYDGAIVLNAVMFAIASITAQLLLRRHCRALIEKNPRHRLLLRAWLIAYAFVGIQMGWVLRPFIGTPDAPTRFFREGAWGNAYIEFAGIAGRALGG
jgi:hypothetical protein